jgi:hypothetical protein
VSVWTDLVDVARYAPSPHNIQPWRLRVASEYEAELLYEPRRLLHETDPSGRFVTVGLGIFVETLSVAAAQLRLVVRVELLGEPPAGRDGPPARFAHLTLIPGDRAEAFAPELIQDRRTSRVAYDGQPVDAHVLAELEAIASAHGQRLVTSSEPELVRFVLELNRQALFFDMTDPSARAEVGSWLRFSERQARRTGDGFAPACLGFPGWLLYAFFHWRAAFDLPGIRQLVRASYLRTMHGTATVAWLYAPFESVDDWFEAGRTLCRLWLAMTARGIYMHPFGSIVTNAAANANLKQCIGEDPSGELLWLIMRLGTGRVPPRSLRLTVDDLVL